MTGSFTPTGKPSDSNRIFGSECFMIHTVLKQSLEVTHTSCRRDIFAHLDGLIGTLCNQNFNINVIIYRFLIRYSWVSNYPDFLSIMNNVIIEKVWLFVVFLYHENISNTRIIGQSGSGDSETIVFGFYFFLYITSWNYYEVNITQVSESFMIHQHSMLPKV